jgi:Ca-activated chloride channel family protein
MMNRTNMIALLTVAAILLPSTYLFASQWRLVKERVAGFSQTSQPTPTPPPEEVGPDDVIRITTNLVTIPVRVLDEKGRYVYDMRAEEFQIFEEGVEQRLAFFAPVESPFTVVLMLDISDSTEASLKDIKEAAYEFIAQLRPHDSVIIALFDSRLNVLGQPTSDRAELRALLDGIQPGGGTRLYDALDLIGKLLLPQIKGRKAIVLFTDGVDIDSRKTDKESLRMFEAADAIIYSIHYDTYAAVAEKMRQANSSLPYGVLGAGRGSRQEDYALASRFLNRLADKTGGRTYEAANTKRLAAAFTLIADELRWQYSIGYYPSKTGEASERRRIQVQVARKRVVVRARDSYIYNAQPPRQ